MKNAFSFVKRAAGGGFRALDKLVWGTSVGRALLLSMFLAAGLPMTAATVASGVLNEAIDEATPGA